MSENNAPSVSREKGRTHTSKRAELVLDLWHREVWGKGTSAGRNQSCERGPCDQLSNSYLSLSDRTTGKGCMAGDNLRKSEF